MKSSRFSRSASAVLGAAPDAIFRTLTDIEGLPRWNTVVTSVLQSPLELEIGSEWVVEVHALGQSWPSRSRVEVLDLASRRFAYRSCSDDGNPSYALWSWTVAGHPAGSRVTVTWEIHPATFWRRVLLVRIRDRQLRRTEVPDSLRALDAAAREPRGATEVETPRQMTATNSGGNR